MEERLYDSDLSDLEWHAIAPILPPEKPVGRGREVDLRAVVNAIFYRADNGIKWRNLPKEYPAWQTVYGYFNLWVKLGVWEQVNLVLAQQVRQAAGREAQPSLVIVDSQSVRLGQKGGKKLASMALRKSKDVSGTSS